ncbi:MAG: Maf family protein [Pseudomonadales bacterium]|nr:Maf family protein [Pseudomonadales bacterium]
MKPYGQIYLASSSPRRAELLQQIGIRFEVIRFSIDETPVNSETVECYATRMAAEKAREGFRLIEATAKAPLPVLAADTIVFAGDEIFCKPESQQHGLEMLGKLSGSTHQVITAVALASKERVETILVKTDVIFRTIEQGEMMAYWGSGEPLDKAGGYAIQGLGAVFVSRIEGSYSGVVGLPLEETARLLKSAGIHCL